jgi:hypothetical protein
MACMFSAPAYSPASADLISLVERNRVHTREMEIKLLNMSLGVLNIGRAFSLSLDFFLDHSRSSFGNGLIFSS